MRKIICLIGALLMCATLVCPVFAATGTFVPSIGYKDGPDVEDAVLDGEDVTGCVVVSSIKAVKEKTTDIDQEDRDLLLEVYEKLDNASMKLPLDDNYVVRELVDVSFQKTDCIEAGHGHKEELAKDGTTITIKFDMGVKKTTEVAVFAYVNGEWTAIESVVNNGDGTVTCVFEDICPVAFCVDADAEDEPAKTGDAVGQNLILWVLLMAVSFVAIVILLVRHRKSSR